MADAGREPPGDCNGRPGRQEPQRIRLPPGRATARTSGGPAGGHGHAAVGRAGAITVPADAYIFPRGGQQFYPRHDGPPELTVPFSGLTGPDGVLPQHYTALLQERARAKDNTFRDFLDLFHHRLLSLQVRAWEKATPAGRARGRPGGSDAGTDVIRAVAGFGTPGLRDRTPVDDDTFSALRRPVRPRPPTAAGLELVLSGYFGWPVDGGAVRRPVAVLAGENDQTGHCRPARTGRPNARLGHDAVAGRRVWDVRHKVRVRVGPLDFAAFQSLRPGGAARAELETLARLYAGTEFDLEVVPVLAADAVPGLALDADEVDGPQSGGERVGPFTQRRPAGGGRRFPVG